MDSDSDYEQEREEIIGIMFDTTDEDTSDDDSSVAYDNWRDDSGIFDMIPNYDPFLETQLIDESQRIYEMEQQYLDSEKQTGKYYIGSAVLVRNRYYIMNTSVTACTFMNFPIYSILFYLHEFSLFHFVKNRIEIMKLHIHPVTMEYIVVLKTFWLRIVQRTWRRILREREEVLRKRCSIQNIKHRSIYGRHQMGLNVLPGLYGMLQNLVISPLFIDDKFACLHEHANFHISLIGV